MQNAEFNHPRLVEVYDAECRWGPDDELFLALVNESPGSRVLDLGCGTGRLTLALAAAGHRVTGLDPARASLDAARAKPGADRVRWLQGTADGLASQAFDTAVMTSHVAQFMTGETAWAATLAQLRRALRPGGRLIFDSRDPAARAWVGWDSGGVRETVALSGGRTVERWTTVTAVHGEVVTFMQHYLFSEDGAELQSINTLRFRPEVAIRAALALAGFEIVTLYGGWQREPVGQGDGEFIVVARSTGP
jgi:2-polyprenyl-3-methyl-5-hydroxy-6-metoxy-1,4-benzoquinol methylase